MAKFGEVGEMSSLIGNRKTDFAEPPYFAPTWPIAPILLNVVVS